MLRLRLSMLPSHHGKELAGELAGQHLQQDPQMTGSCFRDVSFPPLSPKINRGLPAPIPVTLKSSALLRTARPRHFSAGRGGVAFATLSGATPSKATSDARRGLRRRAARAGVTQRQARARRQGEGPAASFPPFFFCFFFFPFLFSPSPLFFKKIPRPPSLSFLLAFLPPSLHPRPQRLYLTGRKPSIHPSARTD